MGKQSFAHFDFASWLALNSKEEVGRLAWRHVRIKDGTCRALQLSI
jgi:hypothetical protein